MNQKKKEKEKFEFREILKTYKQVEQMIKDKKIKKMRKDDKLILSKYFIDKNNKNSLLSIFGQDSYDFFLSENIKFNEIEKNEKINKLKQILEYYKIDYKKYKPDFEKAKMIKERMPLIKYLFKIKDENKTESEMQQIIEKYNSLEKFISERNSKKAINIENETKSQLLDYFKDKNNEDFLIKIFGKENYEFALKYFNENMDDKFPEKDKRKDIDKQDKNNTKENYNAIKNQNNIENSSLNLLSSSTKLDSTSIPIIKTNNSQQIKSYEEKLANHILEKSEVILNTKKEAEKLFFLFESVSYGNNHIFISNDKLEQIKQYLKNNKIENKIAKSYFKYMEFLDEFKKRIYKEFINEYKLKIGLEFQIIDKDNNGSIFYINCNYKFYSPDLKKAPNR